jgi:hypothetical protein
MKPERRPGRLERLDSEWNTMQRANRASPRARAAASKDGGGALSSAKMSA